MKVLTHTLGQVKNSDILSKRHVAHIVKQVLRQEKSKGQGELNVVFVDNRWIKKLNKQFLHKASPTDVIAFSYPSFQNQKSHHPFGDIYISVPVARANAKHYQQTLKKELTRLVIHGLLHILGYDDHTKKEKNRMWARQEPLVEKQWLANK